MRRFTSSGGVSGDIGALLAVADLDVRPVAADRTTTGWPSSLLPSGMVEISRASMFSPPELMRRLRPTWVRSWPCVPLGALPK